MGFCSAQLAPVSLLWQYVTSQPAFQMDLVATTSSKLISTFHECFARPATRFLVHTVTMQSQCGSAAAIIFESLREQFLFPRTPCTAVEHTVLGGGKKAVAIAFNKLQFAGSAGFSTASWMCNAKSSCKSLQRL